MMVKTTTKYSINAVRVEEITNKTVLNSNLIKSKKICHFPTKEMLDTFDIVFHT